MNAIVKTDSQLPVAAPSPDSSSLIAAIANAARDPAVDVTKMERLFAMHKELQADQAARAFAESMSAAQREMPRIAKDRRNEQTGSDYATLEAIDAAIRPIYTRHGLALAFDTEDAQDKDTVRIACSVMHRDGHSRVFRYDSPLDSAGIAGKVNKTPTHARGSAVTYGRRYLTLMIFNLSTGYYDDDGNGAGAGLEDDLDNTAATWIATADNIKTEEQYKRARAQLMSDYGKADSIPQPVRTAFNRAKARVSPQD